MVSVAENNIVCRTKRLKVSSWLKVQTQERGLTLSVDQDALKENSRLDGCYVIKTDLPKAAATKEIVHGRHKDLSLVEKAFRTCKQTFLEVRPVYVRNEKSARGHVLIVMLAYMIARQLQAAWVNFDLTPEEGLRQLAALTYIKIKVKDNASCWMIPRPTEQSLNLLDAPGINMPSVLPHRYVHADTGRKLSERRITN